MSATDDGRRDLNLEDTQYLLNHVDEAVYPSFVGVIRDKRVDENGHPVVVLYFADKRTGKDWSFLVGYSSMRLIQEQIGLILAEED